MNQFSLSRPSDGVGSTTGDQIYHKSSLVLIYGIFRAFGNVLTPLDRQHHHRACFISALDSCEISGFHLRFSDFGRVVGLDIVHRNFQNEAIDFKSSLEQSILPIDDGKNTFFVVLDP